MQIQIRNQTITQSKKKQMLTQNKTQIRRSASGLWLGFEKKKVTFDFFFFFFEKMQWKKILSLNRFYIESDLCASDFSETVCLASASSFSNTVRLAFRVSRSTPFIPWTLLICVKCFYLHLRTCLITKFISMS